MNEGIIYIARNPAYKEDIYKVGKTERTNLAINRMMELSNHEGVAGQFQVVGYLLVEDIHEAEKICHQELKKYRYQNNREFFEINLNDLASQIRDVLKGKILKEYLPKENKVKQKEVTNEKKELFYWNIIEQISSTLLDMLPNKKNEHSFFKSLEDELKKIINNDFGEDYFSFDKIISEKIVGEKIVGEYTQINYLSPSRTNRINSTLVIDNPFSVYFFHTILDNKNFKYVSWLEGQIYNQKDVDERNKHSLEHITDSMLRGCYPMEIRKGSEAFVDSPDTEVVIQNKLIRRPIDIDAKITKEIIKNDKNIFKEIRNTKRKIDELYNDDSWFENSEKHPTYKMIHDKNAVQFSVLVYKSNKLYKQETAEILKKINEEDINKWSPFNPNSKLSKKYGSHFANYYLHEPESIYLLSGSPLRIIKEAGQIFSGIVGGVLGASVTSDPNYLEFPPRNN